MATLIAAYKSDGTCIGRCDAKCYNAECSDCHCICGGVNHGAGIDQAAANTEEMADDWIAKYADMHPDAARFDVTPPEVAATHQLVMPGFEPLRRKNALIS